MVRRILINTRENGTKKHGEKEIFLNGLQQEVSTDIQKPLQE